MKSDQYCTPDQNGEFYMFLLRASIGTPLVTRDPMTDLLKAPPLPSDPSRNYDSVIATCKKYDPQAKLDRFREFAVYYGTQVYPEFLFSYKRV